MLWCDNTNNRTVPLYSCKNITLKMAAIAAEICWENYYYIINTEMNICWLFLYYGPD